MFEKLVCRLVSLVPTRRKGGAQDVLESERFNRVIERERSRSDRNSHGFSMVVFSITGGDGDRVVSLELAKILQNRMRLTDVVGWIGGDRMGVLLPDTHPDGARKFSDHIRCAMVNRFGIAPECLVYGYPEDLGPDGAGQSQDDRQLWFKGLVEEVETGSVGSILARSFAKPKEVESVSSPSAGFAQWDMAVADGVIDEAIRHSPLTWKRLFDVAGSAVGLVIVSPVMLLTALLIKAVSPGPVFFQQERVGYLGRTFTCLKFRTMHVSVDSTVHKNYFSRLIGSSVPMKKLDTEEDPRLIPFARIIRQLAIDELPQLINVLRGDMSLIGPRPCIPYEYREYSRWHRQRIRSLPGMTGLWQVSGKNRTTFSEMMRMDISYGRKRNILLDVAIVLRTVPAIIGQVLDSVSARLRN